MSLALANAGVNLAIYIYVFAAPRFVYQHLGLGAQSFGWLFIPIVAGIIAGALVAHRIAGRTSPESSVNRGHIVMMVAGVFNLAVAGGGLIGGLVTDQAGPGWLPWILLPLVMTALATVWQAKAHGFRAGRRAA